MSAHDHESACGRDNGEPAGTNATGKLYTVLRRLGFNAVFDTTFAADVTIMEEASEFVERFVHGKGPLPLITSCCPSWVIYLEKQVPDMVGYFSSCKSPQQISGLLTKTYYAEKMNIDPSKIVVVSIMPCTSKKTELTRTEEMFASGYQDVDYSLTTRELARMIKDAGIEPRINPLMPTEVASENISSEVHTPAMMIVPRAVTPKPADVNSPSRMVSSTVSGPKPIRSLPHTPCTSAP